MKLFQIFRQSNSVLFENEIIEFIWLKFSQIFSELERGVGGGDQVHCYLNNNKILT